MPLTQSPLAIPLDACADICSRRVTARSRRCINPSMKTNLENKSSYGFLLMAAAAVTWWQLKSLQFIYNHYFCFIWWCLSLFNLLTALLLIFINRNLAMCSTPCINNVTVWGVWLTATVTAWVRTISKCHLIGMKKGRNWCQTERKVKQVDSLIKYTVYLWLFAYLWAL